MSPQTPKDALDQECNRQRARFSRLLVRAPIRGFRRYSSRNAISQRRSSPKSLVETSARQTNAMSFEAFGKPFCLRL